MIFGQSGGVEVIQAGWLLGHQGINQSLVRLR
jgi:hypothetical protein